MAIHKNFLFSLGRPFSPMYGFAMTVRQAMYRNHLLPCTRVAVPVVSVGNLVLGGSGKTPLVIAICEMLIRNNFSPAIISRGYRGKAKAKVNVVSDGRSILLSPTDAGDEPYLMARRLPKVPVLTGSRRVDPAQYCAEHLPVDCIVLDDGFQHMALHRDIDCVLFDAETLAGNSRVFPGGVLREPVSALERCHCFVITGLTQNNRERAAKFGDVLLNRFPNKHLFFSEHLDLGIDPPIDGSVKDRIFGFCGIANPTRFQNSLESMGIQLKDFHAFRDHAHYNHNHLRILQEKAESSGAVALITTEKDAVKLQSKKLGLPLHIAQLQTSLDRHFESYLLKHLKQCMKNEAM